jgi:hypothetical protein
VTISEKLITDQDLIPISFSISSHANQLYFGRLCKFGKKTKKYSASLKARVVIKIGFGQQPVKL